MAPSLRELSRRLRETRRAAEGVGPYGVGLRLSYSPECLQCFGSVNFFIVGAIHESPGGRMLFFAIHPAQREAVHHSRFFPVSGSKRWAEEPAKRKRTVSPPS